MHRNTEAARTLKAHFKDNRFHKHLAARTVKLLDHILDRQKIPGARNNDQVIRRFARHDADILALKRPLAVVLGRIVPVVAVL